MARTAPAPNIPPIPGMCPSIAVMGGGGGGGGSGGDGTGDGDGSGGPGGDGSTDGASGDGRNGGNGCGDPVCPITGRVFLEVLDFGFWGPLPIKFVRHYSSRASDQVGELGRGFTYVYGWELKVLRDRLVVRDGNARKHVLEGLPTPGEPVMDTLGIMATFERGAFEITDTNDGLRYVFGPELRSGIRRAVAVRDRYGNTIQLERDDKGTLKRIVDSAGRPYAVTADERGLIRSIRVAADERASAWIELVRYEYDEESRLVAVTDAEGFTSRLDYVGGLLVAHHTASGLTYHYRYDGETKHAYCVETWGSRSGPDPALETPIKSRGGPKGIHYAKLTYDKQARYAEVENGLGGFDRYYGDAVGRVVKQVTAAGGVIDRAFDSVDGAMKSYTDVRRASVMVQDGGRRAVGFSDSTGRGVRRSIEPDGTETTVELASGATVQRRFDARGDLVFIRHADGTVEEFGSDERGLQTFQTDRLGGRRTFTYDAHGNLSRIDHPGGTVELSEYDYLGRRIRHIDALGNETLWAWDRRNEIVQKRTPGGLLTVVERDANRNPTRVVEGGSVTIYEWGGMGWLTAMTKPGGQRTEYRYDVQGNLVRVVNARGDVYTQEFDHAGRFRSCKTFEGVVHRAGWTAAGDLSFIAGPGGKDSCVHDAQGRLVEATLRDGTSVALSWGHPLAPPTVIDNGIVRIESEYDPMGRPVLDRQDDISTTLRWHGGELSGFASDVGPAVTYGRGPSERIQHIAAGPFQTSESWSVEGDVVTEIGDDLVLRRRYGQDRALVFQGLAKRSLRPLDQCAVEDDPKILFWVRYAYDGERRLRIEERSDGTRIDLDLDAAGQIVERRVQRKGAPAEVERWAYDAVGSPKVAGARYDLLHRPIELLGERLEYDDASRLAARHDDSGTTRYRWDANDNLIGVDGPKRRIEMRYDARGRRCEKAVFEGTKRMKKIRYVWSNNTLLHEIDESGRTRTYIRKPLEWTPLGHVDSTPDGVAQAIFYLQGAADSVDLAIDATGNIVWEPNLTAYGVARPTVDTVPVSWRFANQEFDEDVGLVYNRMRWYEPRLATYVTPDPLRLQGTFNPRDYVENPWVFSDPMGLTRRPSSEPSPGAPGGPPANHPNRPPRPASTADMNRDYLAAPGHWATDGNPGGPPGWIDCPASHLNESGNWGSSSDPTSIRSRIDAAGSQYGCHTCGSRDPAGPDGPAGSVAHWTPDHVPPCNSFNHGTPRGDDLAPYPSRPWAGSVRLYPQCRQCSNSQGGLESHATDAQREASRRRVVANNRAHSGLTVNSPRT